MQPLHKVINIDQLNIKDKILFIHIPKNAGTSITEILGISYTTHVTASEIWHSKFKQLLYKLYSIAIVRNPYERFVSLYNYARMDISYYHNNIDPGKSKYGIHLDYEMLKSVDINKCAELLIEGELLHDNSWNHWLPQYTWIYDESKNHPLVSNIFHLENIVELKKFLNDILPSEINLSVINKSKTTVPNILDKRSIEILNEYYNNDFKYFNYKKL